MIHLIPNVAFVHQSAVFLSGHIFVHADGGKVEKGNTHLEDLNSLRDYDEPQVWTLPR